MKTILCDICHQPLTLKHYRSKFKTEQHGRFFDPKIKAYWEGWVKLDICDDCWNEFKHFVEAKQQSFARDNNLIHDIKDGRSLRPL